MDTIYRYTGIVTVWGVIILGVAVILLWLTARVLDARKKMIRDRHWLWCWYEWAFRRRTVQAQLARGHKPVWNPRYFRVFDYQPQPYRSYYYNLYGQVLVGMGWLAKHGDWRGADQHLAQAEEFMCKRGYFAPSKTA